MIFHGVRIIALHFANCKVNSNYCDYKIVNHTKIAKQFFSQGKFNSFKLYFSKLYPYFIHPLHTIIKRNTTYIQNYPKKCKKCLAFLKRHFRLRRGKSPATLGIFIAKWILNDNSNAVPFLNNFCIKLTIKLDYTIWYHLNNLKNVSLMVKVY